jgi:5-methylcytosine-specific restriction endonuclease McrA
MSRREFSKEVRRQAVKRAAGFCEGRLPNGCRCEWPLSLGKWAIDHINPDGLTGEPTLENAQVLCTACHLEKTRLDVKRIAQAKRREDAHLGTAAPAKIQGQGFRKAIPKRRATTPVEKALPARRSLFIATPERS